MAQEKKLVEREVIHVAVESNPQNYQREGQLGFGTGTTSDLATFDQKEVLYPEVKNTKQKHQMPKQVQEGVWESPYGI